MARYFTTRKHIDTTNYFLKNIAQNSLLRTILLFVLGLAMWLPKLLLHPAEWATTLSTLALVIVNSIILMQCFYKNGTTNLPSGFVAATYMFAMSALPILQGCWQCQIVALGIVLALLVLLKMDFQREATEEAFLATLIWCFAATKPIMILVGILFIWGYLFLKGKMTWRVWMATLLAFGTRVILMTILHKLDWWQWIWMENIPSLAWQVWAIFSGVYLLTIVAIELPLRKPSIASGVIYVVFTLLLASIDIVWIVYAIQNNNLINIIV